MYQSCSAYRDAGNSGPCRELSVTGNEYDNLEQAVEDVAQEIMGLQEESGSEWAIVFSENENEKIVPTVAVAS